MICSGGGIIDIMILVSYGIRVVMELVEAMTESDQTRPDQTHQTYWT